MQIEKGKQLPSSGGGLVAIASVYAGLVIVLLIYIKCSCFKEILQGKGILFAECGRVNVWLCICYI